MGFPFLAIEAKYLGSRGTYYAFVLVPEDQLPKDFENLLARNGQGVVYGQLFFSPALNRVGQPLYRRLYVHGGDQTKPTNELFLEVLDQATLLVSPLKEHSVFLGGELRREAAEQLGITVLEAEVAHVG